MNPKTLRQRLQQFPRLDYFNAPSPLEPLPRLTQKLDGPTLWIKRDDGLGPGLGGNKGRKLAYIMAEVLEGDYQKVITFGGLQSNHARMTAAACARLGLEAHLFLFGKRPRQMPLPLTHNLLLDQLFGAKLHFIPFGGGGDATLSLETTNRLVRLLSRLMVGRKAYFMPVGGHNLTGCLGYVAAALELHEQVLAHKLPPEKVTIILAAGTGGTLAGLMAGFRLLNSPIRLLGLDIGKLWRSFPASIARLAGQLCQKLGEPHHFSPGDVPMIEHTYAGEAYAEPTREMETAVSLLAQTEGILLDPVYTGKAFAGLLDLIQKNHFSPEDTLIFLHTGGLPWSMKIRD